MYWPSSNPICHVWVDCFSIVPPFNRISQPSINCIVFMNNHKHVIHSPTHTFTWYFHTPQCHLKKNSPKKGQRLETRGQRRLTFLSKYSYLTHGRMSINLSVTPIPNLCLTYKLWSFPRLLNASVVKSKVITRPCYNQDDSWPSRTYKPRIDYNQLNRRWRTNLTATQWVQVWKKVWGSPTFHREWVFIWRVLNHGLLHYRRALIWGLSGGLCPCCNVHTKIVEHMLFECREIRRRWDAIAVRLMGSRLAPTFMKGSLGEILYAGIMRAQHNLVSLIVTVEMLVSIWHEQNVVAYRG